MRKAITMVEFRCDGRWEVELHGLFTGCLTIVTQSDDASFKCVDWCWVKTDSRAVNLLLITLRACFVTNL